VFFVASKLVEIACQPVNVFVGIIAAGLALNGTKQEKLGRVAIGFMLGLALVVSWSPLGALLLRPLEDRFPPPPLDMPAPTGIVVLGGALDEDIGAARGQPTLREAGARLTAAVALARKYPSARLVFTGGSGDVRQSGLDEARGVHALWLSLGVPETRMTFEDASRNTYENATMTHRIVQPKQGERWVLLTSASHMPRSMGIFRANGWPMIAYPVDYRTFGDKRDFAAMSHTVTALQNLTTAVYEWTGLLAYRLAGRTDALFPTP
jgi:uncharacterized SAM-binding protein YcdF (DUF218 family)